MKKILCALLLTLTSSIYAQTEAHAQTGPLGWGDKDFKDPIATDRPDFTEATTTVDSGHYQFELGYTFAKDNTDSINTKEHVAPEMLARIGLADDLEARVILAGYLSSEVAESHDEGVSDLGLGFKHKMYDQQGVLPELSYIAELYLPTSEESDELQPVFKYLWAYDLEKFAVSGNLNFTAPLGEEQRYFEVSNSVSLGVGLTDSLGAYLEYFGFYPVDEVTEPTEHYLNSGLTLLASRDVQFDVRAGVGLNDDAADFFAGIGISFRN